MRHLLRDLVRPRYAALSALMVVVAAICVVAGTWQIFRYDGKHLANDDLRTNAHDAAVRVDTVLPVLGGAGVADGGGVTPAADAVEFRAVTATGSYDAAGEVLVRRQQVGDDVGEVVLTPLRTTSGAILLVARGFLTDTSAGTTAAPVTPAPAGTVQVTGRVQAGSTGDDRFGDLGGAQVDLVNPAQAAARLGGPVYAGYVELEAGEPGTAGLTAFPAPDLSNPAGGAFELQHLAYIVQWYLFAGLALAAPVVMVRTDRRRARDDAAALAAHAREVERARPMSKELVPVNPGGSHARTVEERLARRYGR